MPVHQKAPWKEATSFSFDDIHQLLDKMPDKEKSYSLRARSSIQIVDGKRQTVYLLFLRNGTEPVFERFDNWWNAKAQRELAKRLVCAALAGRPATPGQGAVPVRSRERALLQVRKMDRMAPGKMQSVFSECIAAQKKMTAFQDKLLAMSAEDRLKFRTLHQQYTAIPEAEKASAFSSIFVRKNTGTEDRINDILSTAELHHSHAVLAEFRRFSEAVAENQSFNQIDLALILELADRRTMLRAESGRADPASDAAVDAGPVAACRKVIDGLLDLCDSVRCPTAPAVTDTSAAPMAVVPGQPPAPPAPPPRRRSPALPVLPAGLFPFLWVCGAGRSAGAVHAASHLAVPAARQVVSRAALPAPSAAACRQVAGKAAAQPVPILPARLPEEITCDWQAELDFADMDRQAVILLQDEGGLFSMAPACSQWLAELRRHQQYRETHFTRVQHQGQVALLAPAQRTPMNGQLCTEQIARLGETYEAAVETAVRQGKPICLTDLFDDDPRTVDQCVEAMLAPIRRRYRMGMQPAVRIRVTSPRLRERIAAALGDLLVVPLAERPALEVIDRLTEADMKLPGLMMVTGASSDYAEGALRGTLSRLYRPHGKPAGTGADAAPRVSPRKSLGGHAATHLYFFARPCPLKSGFPDGARIAGEYAAFFEEARQRRCQLVTLEILSETPGQEGQLIAALSAAIMAAQARSPGLKVRLLTRNPAIRAGLQSCF